MYIRLKQEMKKKKKYQRDIAKLLGISEIQVSKKMNNISDFRLKEAIEIKNLLDTELTLEELFYNVE